MTSPFKHHRMTEAGGGRPRVNNVEFSNRMFLQDEDDLDDQSGAFTLDEIEPSTNFVNPVYETMFLVRYLSEEVPYLFSQPMASRYGTVCVVMLWCFVPKRCYSV